MLRNGVTQLLNNPVHTLKNLVAVLVLTTCTWVAHGALIAVDFTSGFICLELGSAVVSNARLAGADVILPDSVNEQFGQGSLAALANISS